MQETWNSRSRDHGNATSGPRTRRKTDIVEKQHQSGVAVGTGTGGRNGGVGVRDGVRTGVSAGVGVAVGAGTGVLSGVGVAVAEGVFGGAGVAAGLAVAPGAGSGVVSATASEILPFCQICAALDRFISNTIELPRSGAGGGEICFPLSLISTWSANPR